MNSISSKNFQPSALNVKTFSQSLDHFFLTVGQNNFGNKMPVSQHILLSTHNILIRTYIYLNELEKNNQMINCWCKEGGLDLHSTLKASIGQR